MTNRYPEFLLAATSSAPRSLPESIRQVSNLSAGFCRSWFSNDTDDAIATSEEAFQLFDHIQNELLRHRNEKVKAPGWQTSPLKAALGAVVGNLLSPATASDKTLFLSLTPGAAALTPGASPAPLTLETALNKLKHRGTSAINFTASPTGTHVLYFFTNAGMQKPDTISCFNVHVFCEACKTAAKTL